MDDVIGAWATRIAEAVAPDEVDLAPDIAEAFVAGGRDRAELFQTAGAVPGGFDAGTIGVIFPYVLSAITTSGAVISAFLASGVADIPGKLKEIIDLWDRFRHRPERATPETQRAYQSLNQVCTAIEAALEKAGFDAERRELLSYQIVREILDNLGGTREFLNAVGSGPGH